MFGYFGKIGLSCQMESRACVGKIILFISFMMIHRIVQIICSVLFPQIFIYNFNINIKINKKTVIQKLPQDLRPETQNPHKFQIPNNPPHIPHPSLYFPLITNPQINSKYFLFQIIYNLQILIYFIQFNSTNQSAMSGLPPPPQNYSQPAHSDRVPVTYNFANEIPISYDKRTCTDILCTIVGIIFTLGLFITALVIFNWDTYVKSNFPTDSQGRLCGVDTPGYKYVYFTRPPQIAHRVCVAECPSTTDTALDCIMTDQIGCGFSTNAQFRVDKYPVQAYDGGREGYYCLPVQQSLKEQLLENSKLDHRFQFIKTLDTIVLSMILSIGISIIYFFLVQCFPRAMNYVVMVLAILLILGLAICMYAYTSQIPGKIPIAILLTVLLLLIVITLFRNRRAVAMNGVFLECSTLVVRDKPAVLLYIPLFIAFLTGFLLMIIYEFRSFWTGGNLYFDKEKSLFHEFDAANSVVLSVFLIIQTVWGLSFLKQAFNFVVSGNAVSWYYLEDPKANVQQSGIPVTTARQPWSCVQPFRIFLCKHFGSVVAGSFMTGFFTLADYVFDLLQPARTRNEGPYHRCFKSVCNPCYKLFDLVRSDSMGYINIAGNPYCNAARYCNYMSNNSAALYESQSTSRGYRISAHFTIAALVGIISIYVKGTIVPTGLFAIIFISLFISTFLISIHADLAEAVAISFVSNEQYSKRHVKQQYEKRSIIYKDFGIRRPEVSQKVDEVLNNSAKP